MKKKNWVLTHISECSFLCTDLLTCIPLHSFRYNLILVFLHSLHCKTCTLVFLRSLPLWSSNTCILASSFIITHIYFLPAEKKNIIFKIENITKLWCRHNTQSERNYFPFPYPLFCFPLLVLQLFPPPPLCLVLAPSAFSSPYSLVPPSPLPWTPVMKIVPPWNPGPLY